MDSFTVPRSWITRTSVRTKDERASLPIAPCHRHKWNTRNLLSLCFDQLRWANSSSSRLLPRIAIAINAARNPERKYRSARIGFRAHKRAPARKLWPLAEHGRVNAKSIPRYLRRTHSYDLAPSFPRYTRRLAIPAYLRSIEKTGRPNFLFLAYTNPVSYGENRSNRIVDPRGSNRK